jgi:circadian clock protein KaiB
MTKYRFKLFITGETTRSTRAVDNLRRFCDKELKDQYELIIIDVLERPEMAEELKILATPTLVKESPPPMRRIIGDLSNIDPAMLGLHRHM